MKKSALDILFGSHLRVKLLRFFMLNLDDVYSMQDLRLKTGARQENIKKELNVLIKARFIKKGSSIEKASPNYSLGSRKAKKGKSSRRKNGYIADPKFPYIREFRHLFTSLIPEARTHIGRNVKKLGKVKTVVICGVFLDRPSNPVDLLIVGDDVRRRALEIMLKKIEKLIGKDIIYSIFPIDEFELRCGMRDKFILSIFNNPHEVLFDELKIIQEEGM